MTDSSNELQRPSATKSGFRTFIPLLVVLILAGLAFYFVDAEHSFTGRPSMDMLLGLGVLNMLVYLWVRSLSGILRATQIKWIAALCGLQIVLFATIQMEGIYGNGRPVFAWRWKSLPADQFANRKSKPAGISIDVSAIELPTNATWPQFRGPNRDGVSSTTIGNWNEDPPHELWRQPIGAGWSSFSIAGDYCFTMEQRGNDECVSCYELKTGKEIWLHSDAERFSEITGGEGPRSTPTFDNGFLYSLGATGVLNCLDAANGDLIWTADILKQHESMNCYYGMCTSPLVVGNLVVVNPGGENASLAAYNKLDGDLVWAAGDSESSYASPHLMTLCGVEQVLNFNADGLMSHDLTSGTVLWKVPWISNEAERNNVCQPIKISESRVFISSGYGRGCALFELSKANDGFQVKTVWQNKKLRSKFASAVFDGQFIYGLDEGILVCLDVESGERLWKQGRYKHGQLLLVGRHLIVQAENGFVAQVNASPEQFTEEARIDALDCRTWTHPVIANNFLITRNDREVVCYGLGIQY